MPAQPSDVLLKQYLQALASASQARDVERAMLIGEEATRRGVEHPNLLGLAAQKRLRAGDAEAALPLLLRARELSPQSADVLNDLGICLMRAGRAQEAVSVLDAALRQRPDTAGAHFNLALAYEQLGELNRMRHELECAISIDENHVQALSLLAMLAADRNDLAAARAHAERALLRSPGEIPARIALVSADIGAGDFAAAGRGLDALLCDPALDADNRAIALTLKGDVLDGERKFAEAFALYSASAELQKAHYARAFRFHAGESLLAQAARLSQFLLSLPDDAERPARQADPGKRTHVFLMGFLRSGTTVLGHVLAGHSGIEVMHERECLDRAVRDFIDAPGGLERLFGMSDETLEPYRQSYWESARDWGHEAKARVFVDKSPLAAFHLPLIAKLFPQARILFSVRDPRDVVFSCFRRRFAMSAPHYEMLSLQGAADCYAGSMALTEAGRARLDLAFSDVRHEALLDDPEGETRRLCDFIGIHFEPGMADFGQRARTTNIDTPGSAQLARGLLRDGPGHWRNYAHALRPVMPVLAPWCARYGYAED